MKEENKTAEKFAQDQQLERIPKLELEMPVMINKNVLTEKMMINLDFMQTGGGSTRIHSRYTNEGIEAYKEYITKAMLYIMDQMTMKLIKESKALESEILVGLHIVYGGLECFEVPEEL